MGGNNPRRAVKSGHDRDPMVAWWAASICPKADSAWLAAAAKTWGLGAPPAQGRVST